MLIIPSANKNMELLELSYFADGNSNFYSYSRKELGSFLKR
jgi:hypothetical protein